MVVQREGVSELAVIGDRFAAHRVVHAGPLLVHRLGIVVVELERVNVVREAELGQPRVSVPEGVGHVVLEQAVQALTVDVVQRHPPLNLVRKL